LDWEASPKVVEENALEGRKPRRARLGHPRFRAEGRRTPSRSEITSGVAARQLAGGKNDRRGETPRGVPLFGRSKALKGEPHGRCDG